MSWREFETKTIHAGFFSKEFSQGFYEDYTTLARRQKNELSEASVLKSEAVQDSQRENLLGMNFD